MGAEQPSVAIGHVSLRVRDLAASVSFYLSVGMVEARPRGETMAILALRGGTHLLLLRARRPAKARALPFDLMVDDVDALQASLGAAGREVGPMRLDRFSSHRSFSCADPDGNVVTFTSPHGGDEHDEQGPA